MTFQNCDESYLSSAFQMSSSSRKMNFNLNLKFWEFLEILKIRNGWVSRENLWYRSAKLGNESRTFKISNDCTLIWNFVIDRVPKVGFHKSVALSIITIFELTSWIFFISWKFFAYSKNVKKCPGAKRQKAPSSSSICWFWRRPRDPQHTIWAWSDQLILEKEQTES